MNKKFLLITKLLNTATLTVTSIVLVYIAFFSKPAILHSETRVLETTSTGVFAILRPDGEGQWYILDDTGHTPHGIESVEQNGGFITVHYAEKFSDIYWSAATPDETLAISDVAVGMSVDRDKARIYLAKSGKHISPSAINTAGSNIWVYIHGAT